MLVKATIAAAIAIALLPAVAGAQDNFYEGKQITLLAGASPGGTNDLYARLLAAHMGRHIPGNPSFVVQNLPGAQGINAMNALYNSQPRDGTAFGTVVNVLLVRGLLQDGFPFDTREFNWLGSLNSETNVLVVKSNAPITSFAEAKETEVILAATNDAADNAIYPRLMNELLGTKFRIITGYAGDAEMQLAMARDEVQGRGAVTWSGIKASNAGELADGSLKVLLQMALQRSPDLPEVPLLLDFIEDPGHRQIFQFLFARQQMGRPFFAPPGVPPERIEILRNAIAETVKDPEFLAEAEKLNLDIDFFSGADMQTLIEAIYATPPDVVSEARRLINAP